MSSSEPRGSTSASSAPPQVPSDRASRVEKSGRGERVDVVVVGSGPNGLAAAVTMARAGLEVLVLEEQDTIGGGARTFPSTMADGIVHDICSAVHPSALASPFFREFDLAARGVDMSIPEISYGQPLRDGDAALAYLDLDRTVEHLGSDGAVWRRFFGPLAAHVEATAELALSTKRTIPWTEHLGAVTAAMGLGTALFGTPLPGKGELGEGRPIGDLLLRGDRSRALLSGVMAHALTALPSWAGSGTAMFLGAFAHSVGWPIPIGGSQRIVDALVEDLEAHGGRILTGRPVREARDLPHADAYLFDTNARAVADILGHDLPESHRRRLAGTPIGSAVSKVDLVTNAPIPWANEELRRAGTIHLGGTAAEVRRATDAVALGYHPEHPVILASDPAQFDPTRERADGLRPIWAYMQVPNGSTVDVGNHLVAEIERFAPGFRDTVVDKRVIVAADLSHHNANYIGGDISAGAITFPRMIGRPGVSLDPFGTGLPNVFLCSAATVPGPGVHGMCGSHAARRALGKVFGIEEAPSLAPDPSLRRAAPG